MVTVLLWVAGAIVALLVFLFLCVVALGLTNYFGTQQRMRAHKLTWVRALFASNRYPSPRYDLASLVRGSLLLSLAPMVAIGAVIFVMATWTNPNDHD